MLRLKIYIMITFLIPLAVSTQAQRAALKKITVGGYGLNITPGADQTTLYLNYLRGRKVGMVINQTSVIGKNLTLSVDSLLKLGIGVKKIFGPEHGFRGNASNGAEVKNGTDAKTGLPVISLYGNKHYKPTPEDLRGLDLLVFDIQDVGARFFTYQSTLQYVMEACAENNVELMILDRPNPNGFYVDGPVLDTTYRSFIGLNPIPVVHGLTLAEYAQMMNGEGWLKDQEQCKLKIIKIANYKHRSHYILPVNPSPNLNTAKSVLLYPSVCLFEGTVLSCGRGTLFPFLQVGHPDLKDKYPYSFTPVSIPGMSESPPLKDKLCYGIDLKNYDSDRLYKDKKLNLSWIIAMYRAFPDKAHFFNAYIPRLAGTADFKKQIEAGKREEEIRASWEPALSNYKSIRRKYLLYPD